jgi:hypothetical protein
MEKRGDVSARRVLLYYPAIAKLWRSRAAHYKLNLRSFVRDRRLANHAKFSRRITTVRGWGGEEGEEAGDGLINSNEDREYRVAAGTERGGRSLVLLLIAQ